MENIISLMVMLSSALTCLAIGIGIKYFKKYSWISSLDPTALSEDELEKIGTFWFWNMTILALFLAFMGIFGFFDSPLLFVIVVCALLLFLIASLTYGYAQGYTRSNKGRRGNIRFNGKSLTKKAAEEKSAESSAGEAAGSGLIRPSRLKVIIFGAAMSVGLLTLGGLLLWSVQDNTVLIDATSLKITGMYGKAYPLTQIESVEQRQSIDWHGHRLNGMSVGSIRKGIFSLEEVGRSRVFVSTPEGPYVVVRMKEGEAVIIGFRDSAQTERIYTDLKRYLP